MKNLDSEGRGFTSKRKEILFQQAMAFLSRVLSGGLLIAGGYFALEIYRHKAAYELKYSERRLEQLASLWTATDRHGMEVLKALAPGEGEDAVEIRLRALGESYYLELAAAGLFLGQERIKNLRSEIGDVWLRDNEAPLIGGPDPKKAKALKEFRSNWLRALRELEVLGETSGR